MDSFRIHLKEGFSLVTQLVKSLPAIQETQVHSLGGEDPLEKEMATHSSTVGYSLCFIQPIISHDVLCI